jgi:hypothetical protein
MWVGHSCPTLLILILIRAVERFMLLRRRKQAAGPSTPVSIRLANRNPPVGMTEFI